MVRKGGDWSEARVGEKEEIGQRLGGRRKGGDWSEARW